MNRGQVARITIGSGLITVAIIAGSLLFLSGVMAAPAGQTGSSASQQAPLDNTTFVSVSSLAFELPPRPTTIYTKDPERQLLLLTEAAAVSNRFFTPLSLPDGHTVMRLTVFGEYMDPNGAIQVFLTRCPHNGQAPCERLASAGVSRNSPIQPRFEIHSTVVPGVTVDNSAFTYLLELELSARQSSGLRSVRLELGKDESTADLSVPGSEAAVAAATADLVQRSGLSSGAISPVVIEPRDWPSTGLGCPQPDQTYLQVVTPGYLIVLEAQGRRYEYHTDRQGQSVVLCSQQ